MKLHVFADRKTCEQALALNLSQQLTEVLANQPFAFLALAGGNTPLELYSCLASLLDTAKLVITPTDERWVAPDSEQSNSHMLGDRFPLAKIIAPAKTQDIENDAAVWQQLLKSYSMPDACLLGMGEDGHIASIFPYMPNRAAALDLNEPPSVCVAEAPAEPRLRLTLNLVMLLHSRWLGLLAFGEKKRELIERAARGSAPELPLQALLSQSRGSVEVFWSP